MPHRMHASRTCMHTQLRVPPGRPVGDGSTCVPPPVLGYSRAPRGAGRHQRHRAQAATSSGDGFSNRSYSNTQQYKNAPADGTSRECVATRRFFQCLKSRDLQGMLALLSNDVVYSNAALKVYHVGKQATVQWYGQVMASLPQSAELVVDDLVASSAPLSHSAAVANYSAGLSARHVTVAWHLEIGGLRVVGSEGVGLLRLDSDTGLITALTDTPKAAIRLLLPALSLATPAIDVLSPVWLPAASVLKASDPGINARLSSSSQGPNPADFLLNAAASLSDMLPAPPASLVPWAIDMYGNSPMPAGFPPSQSSTNAASDSASHHSSHHHRHHHHSHSHSDRRGTTQNHPEPRATSTSAQAATSASAAAHASTPGSSKPTTRQPVSRYGPSKAMRPINMRPLAPPPPGRTVTAKVVEAVAFETTQDGFGSVVEASFEDVSTAADFNGVWEKDTAASQPEQYERMLDVLGLSGLQRVTARLIEGIEIKHDSSAFTVNFLTVVPFFKVTERIQFGSTAKLMRRDLKPGSQTATVQMTPTGGVRVSFQWGEPSAGSLSEEYEIVRGSPNEMTVMSLLKVGSRSAEVKQLYRRTGKDRDALLRESRARNQSMESVLAKQKAQWGN